MKLFLTLAAFIVLIASSGFAQNPNDDSLITILDHSWQRFRPPSKKVSSEASRPSRPMTQSDKNFQRTAREQQTKGAVDPYEYTVDGRSTALEKNVHDARAAKPDDPIGYLYIAKVKNDSDRTTEVVFLEYRFTELANPLNVVRRQFICVAHMKPGEKKELSAFSLLGPSEVITAESLASSTGKLFDERVLINRIEYSDDAVLQRRDWKYDEVKKGIDRATSTPWGKEVCRGI